MNSLGSRKRGTTSLKPRKKIIPNLPMKGIFGLGENIIHLVYYILKEFLTPTINPRHFKK